MKLLNTDVLELDMLDLTNDCADRGIGILKSHSRQFYATMLEWYQFTLELFDRQLFICALCGLKYLYIIYSTNPIVMVIYGNTEGNVIH